MAIVAIPDTLTRSRIHEEINPLFHASARCFTLALSLALGTLLRPFVAHVPTSQPVFTVIP